MKPILRKKCTKKGKYVNKYIYHYTSTHNFNAFLVSALALGRSLKKTIAFLRTLDVVK